MFVRLARTLFCCGSRGIEIGSDNAIRRLFGGCILLGLVYSCIVSASQRDVSLLLFGSVLFLTYVFSASILMGVIAYRLHISHNVEKLKFGLLDLLLFSALVALPLAFANWNWELYCPETYNAEEGEKFAFVAMVGLGALLTLYPILLVAEATLSLIPRSFIFWFRRRIQK